MDGEEELGAQIIAKAESLLLKERPENSGI
jgi:hypothetical protein